MTTLTCFPPYFLPVPVVLFPHHFLEVAFTGIAPLHVLLEQLPGIEVEQLAWPLKPLSPDDVRSDQPQFQNGYTPVLRSFGFSGILMLSSSMWVTSLCSAGKDHDGLAPVRRRMNSKTNAVASSGE